MNRLKDTFDVGKEGSQNRVMALKLNLEGLLKLPIYDESVFIAPGVQLIGKVILQKFSSVWFISGTFGRGRRCRRNVVQTPLC